MTDVCNSCHRKVKLLKKQICYSCHSANRPKVKCQRCGQQRPVHRRTEGGVYCQACSIHLREKRPCIVCQRVTRIVAREKCGSCYDKWKYSQQAPKRLSQFDPTDDSTFSDGGYEAILRKAAGTNSQAAKKLKEIVMKKKRRSSNIIMIPVSIQKNCIFCEEEGTHERPVNGQRVYLCKDHYLEKRLGQIVAHLREKQNELPAED